MGFIGLNVYQLDQLPPYNLHTDVSAIGFPTQGILIRDTSNSPTRSLATGVNVYTAIETNNHLYYVAETFAQCVTEFNGGGTGMTLTGAVTGTGFAPVETRILVNKQVFNSDGTWVKPAFGNFVRIVVDGGGGGGGGGFRADANEFGTASGGGGGGGGGHTDITLPFDQLPAMASIVVGIGGNGGGIATVDFTSGGDGIDGGFSTFQFDANGAIALATGGTHGRGGTDTTGQNGEGGIGMFIGSNGGIGAINSVATPDNVPYGGGGGGGGGGWNDTTAFDGGSGSSPNGSIVKRANGGTHPSGNGENGNNLGIYSPGGGAGGGAGVGLSGSPAGKGGNGALYGGGGAGGGGSASGVNSGAGGNGANGLVVVYTF